MNSKIILVRHGETDGNVSGKFHGHFDSDLTPRGERQILLLADRLVGFGISSIYSSDLKRAFKTADAVASRLGLCVQTDRRLREISCGDLEDKTWDEVKSEYPEIYEKWNVSPHKVDIPSGENICVFQKRVSDCILDIAGNNAGSNVLVATHGTVIKVLVCFFTKVSMENFEKVPWVDNTSITVFSVDENFNFTLELLGDTRHLEGEMIFKKY